MYTEEILLHRKLDDSTVSNYRFVFSHFCRAVFASVFFLPRQKVSDFLEMEGVPEPHHVLMAKGLLHRWTPGMKVIFVSHQWLGMAHPDPMGRHAAVLRGTLQGVLDGSWA